jgi:regulator of cell morphogenesis and NO signaling
MVEEMTLTAELTLAEVARNLPQAAGVFETLGIDYCCRGARSLGEAAMNAGLAPEELIETLLAAQPDGARDWNHRALAELTTFLSADHEVTIRTTLQSVRDAINAAAEASGAPEAKRIASLFASYSLSVTKHMLNEERDLFPLIERVELAASNGGTSAPTLRMSQRVLREFVEHEGFREKLRTMRELAWQLGNSPAASALRERLRQCSREVHEHIHLENNILYPRAIEMENAVKRAV